MTVELLAARVTAPYLGSSLYTWTGIIASVLFGIAVGAFVGGKLADKSPSKVVLAGALVLAGVTVALGYLIASLIGPWLGSTWPVPYAMPVFALCVFFPPSVFLAAVQPAAIKRDLQEMGEAGRVVGLLGSWNAAGSILGTYLAGFVFNYYFSTRLVWFVIAALLVGAGLWVWLRSPKSHKV